MTDLPLKPRCNTCAFTKGTPANLCILTRLKAELCVDGYEPFFCHENILPDDTLPPGKEHLCRGWAEAVQGKPYPDEWRRKVALRLIEVVDTFESRPDATDDEIQSAIVQAMMELA